MRGGDDAEGEGVYGRLDAGVDVMVMKVHPFDGDVGEMAKVGAHDSGLE